MNKQDEQHGPHQKTGGEPRCFQRVSNIIPASYKTVTHRVKSDKSTISTLQSQLSEPVYSDIPAHFSQYTMYSNT